MWVGPDGQGAGLCLLQQIKQLFDEYPQDPPTEEELVAVAAAKKAAKAAKVGSRLRDTGRARGPGGGGGMTAAVRVDDPPLTSPTTVPPHQAQTAKAKAKAKATSQKRAAPVPDAGPSLSQVLPFSY